MSEDKADFAERTISSREAFSGHLLRLRVDTVELPDGTSATREIIEHPGAAAMVALTEDNEVLLVRQWRHPIGRVSLEIPAGTLDAGETVEDCARRELVEEIGYWPGELRRLGAINVSPGYSNEVIHIFLARELQPYQQQAGDGGWRPDPDENLKTVAMPLGEAVRLCAGAEISDAKSVTGILLAWELVESGDML
jgi:ADP-ribose pyrophosphatase